MAVVLPALTFSAGDFGEKVTPNANTAVVARDIAIVLGIVMFLASLAIIAFVVRSLLVLRRRKDDNQPEIERQKPRTSWTGYALLVLTAFSVVMAVRWALMERPHGDNSSTGAMQGSPESPGVSHVPSAKSLPTPGAATSWPLDEIPRWILPICLFGAFAGVVAVFLRGVFPGNTARASAARDIEEIARAIGEQLAHGADLSDSVVACYRDMCAALAEKLKIGAPMTPREFVDRLSETGFPVRHVAVLTQLFERVRYGHERLDEKERARAREALTSIRLQAGGSIP